MATPSGFTSAGALAISPSMEKGRLRHAQGFAADHPGEPRCRKCSVVATSVPANNHERTGGARQGAAGQAQLRLVRSRQPAASGRRTVQTDRPRSTSCMCRYRGAAPAVNDLLDSRCRIVFLDLPGAARPFKPASSADRGRRAGARTERARCADDDRSRHAEPADRELVRHGGAGRHAGADRGGIATRRRLKP